MNDFMKQQGVDDEADAVDDSTDGGDYVAEDKPNHRNALVIFAVLVLGIGGIYLMRVRSGPQTASANEMDEDATKATIDTFLNDGGRSLRAMQEMIRDTEKVVGRFREFPSAAQVPLADLKTNPFRFSTTLATENVDEELLKKRREEERRVVLVKVQALKVQSIVFGESHRMCMINNNPVNEGQEVDGLRVEQIRPNSVIVRGGAYRFEIKMQR